MHKVINRFFQLVDHSLIATMCLVGLFFSFRFWEDCLLSSHLILHNFQHSALKLTNCSDLVS